MSSNTRLALLALIIAVAVIGGFALSVPHTREVPGGSAKGAASTTPAVTLRDTYKKGVHTLSGSITAPNACTSVSALAALATSSEQRILLDLSMPATVGLCLEVARAVPFSTTLTAPASLPVEVRVNGALATTTP